MIYKIYEQDAKLLLEKPETGMGYQIIRANLYSKKAERTFVVYNTNLAVDLDSNFDFNRRRIILEGYRRILNKVSEIMLDTNSIKVLDRELSISDSTDNSKEFANGSEVFVRISAYEDDKRIDFEKLRLKEGSFVTTINDYLNCVNTKNHLIDRYALAYNETDKWTFYIKPKSIDLLQREIVRPAFSPSGGVLLVFFEKGTSVNSYLFKKPYGE